MNIEESELNEIVEKRSKYLQGRKLHVESFFTLGFSVCSALMAQIFVQKTFIKAIFWILAALYSIYIIYQLFICIKNRYTQDVFLKNIKNSDRIRNFSLIVLKDKSGIHKDSYLLRYDRRWKCWLLPYRRTNENDDVKAITEYISNVLELKDSKINSIKTDDIEKLSVSDQIKKKYHHTFYEISFSLKDSPLSKKDTICINKEKFRWFTVDEMKRNRSIEQKNSETVDFIARNF